MERLTTRDLESLTETLRETYALRTLEGFPAGVFATLARIIPSDYYAFAQVDPRAGRLVSVAAEPGIDGLLPDSERVFERHLHEHPLVIAQQTSQEALKLSDFVTQRELRRLALYNEFLRPTGVRFQMSIPLAAARGVLVGVVVNRCSLDFSERERLLLNLVRPHLAQAYRNAEAFTVAHRALNVVGGEIVRFGADGDGRAATERSAQLLEAYFGAEGSLVNGLPTTLVEWIRREQSRFRGAVDGPPPARPLIVDRGERRLVVRLLAGDGAGEEGMLLLQERAFHASPSSLLPLGLSPREAEVLSYIAGGEANEEIASALRLSLGTVEKHLEHIYAKLGVHSRSAAAARAFRQASMGE